MRRSVFLSLLVCGQVLVFAQHTHALTGLLSDCYKACNHNRPNKAECEAACAAAGCPSGWWWSWRWASGERTDIQRCLYTVSGNPVAPGAWVPSAQDQLVSNCCNIPANCPLSSSAVSYAFTTTASVTLSTTITLAQSSQAEINLELLKLSGGVTTTAAFTAGATLTGGVTQTRTTTGNCQAPPCGSWVCYLNTFTSSRAATVTVSFSYEGICGTASACANRNWQRVKTCDQTATLAGSQMAFQWTPCPVTCTSVQEPCTVSSTTTGVCNNTTYQGAN